IQLHPNSGICLVPNASDERNGILVNHNSFRCRGAEFPLAKPTSSTRIVALGGSTTYCTGVSDNQTWEYVLNEQLGTNYGVINMGAPGISSIENLIQSALLFSEVKPDIALY